MKKLTILIVIVLLASIVLGPTAALADDAVVLDLTKAKELALENSRLLTEKQIAADKSAVNEKKATDAYHGSNMDGYINHKVDRLAQLQRELEDLISSGAPQSEITAKQTEMATIEVQVGAIKSQTSAAQTQTVKNMMKDAKYAAEDAQRAIKDAEELLALKVEKDYSGLLEQEAKIIHLQKSYDLQQKMLQIERLKAELGISTTIDVNGVVVTATSLSDGLAQLKNAVSILRLQFNDLLGQERDSLYTLQEYPIPIEVTVPAYEELTENLLTNYALYGILERTIAVQQDRLKDNSIKDANDQKLAKLSIQEFEIDLADLEVGLRSKASLLLNDLNSKQELYNVAKLSFNTAKTTYEWDKVKYDLGLIAKLQYEASELNFLDTQNKLYKAGHELYLAKRAVELAQKGIIEQTQQTQQG